MTAKFVTFHDDDCGERLTNGFCPKCRFVPDMQSLSGAYFCPVCDAEADYKTMTCSKCKQVLAKP